MLSGKGYEKVYNLSGGIKAWNKQVAVGPIDSGMYLFPEDITVTQALVTGFGLEEGLREFYVTMAKRATNSSTAQLFEKLADVEILHQEQLVKMYSEFTGKSQNIEEFRGQIVEPAMEGGLTTEEYISRFDADFDSELDVLSLALMIEAQALDLYMRGAAASDDETVKNLLYRISEEERSHIARLAKYIEENVEVS